MLSDMVWRGSSHRHIMTSGGTIAIAARTAQLENDPQFPAMPMMSVADIQSMAMTRLIENSCMFQA